jgi:hypothetical protein
VRHCSPVHQWWICNHTAAPLSSMRAMQSRPLPPPRSLPHEDLPPQQSGHQAAAWGRLRMGMGGVRSPLDVSDINGSATKRARGTASDVSKTAKQQQQQQQQQQQEAALLSDVGVVQGREWSVFKMSMFNASNLDGASTSSSASCIAIALFYTTNLLQAPAEKWRPSPAGQEGGQWWCPGSQLRGRAHGQHDGIAAQQPPKGTTASRQACLPSALGSTHVAPQLAMQSSTPLPPWFSHYRAC